MYRGRNVNCRRRAIALSPRDSSVRFRGKPTVRQRKVLAVDNGGHVADIKTFGEERLTTEIGPPRACRTAA